MAASLMHAVVLFADDAVATASDFFELFAIENSDASAQIFDEFVIL